eukprot:8990826-Pyramimonas_sp.AAC.1
MLGPGNVPGGRGLHSERAPVKYLGQGIVYRGDAELLRSGGAQLHVRPLPRREENRPVVGTRRGRGESTRDADTKPLLITSLRTAEEFVSPPVFFAGDALPGPRGSLAAAAAAPLALPE